jgi:hypothetical protein
MNAADYPNSPGFKSAGPSEQAATAISSTAKTLRDQVLKTIAEAPAGLSADAVADQPGRSVLAIRPRVSELRRLGEIQPTTQRVKNLSGKHLVTATRSFACYKCAMTTPTPEERRWHWAEGNKYALEAMKALLWLNGGSAAAMLAFFGARARLITPAFGWSLIWFGIGAFLSVVLFVIAYFTQLEYANKGITRSAHRLHSAAYVPLLGSLIAFLLGLWCGYSAIVPAVGG